MQATTGLATNGEQIATLISGLETTTFSVYLPSQTPLSQGEMVSVRGNVIIPLVEHKSGSGSVNSLPHSITLTASPSQHRVQPTHEAATWSITQRPRPREQNKPEREHAQEIKPTPLGRRSKFRNTSMSRRFL